MAKHKDPNPGWFAYVSDVGKSIEIRNSEGRVVALVLTRSADWPDLDAEEAARKMAAAFELFEAVWQAVDLVSHFEREFHKTAKIAMQKANWGKR